MKFCKKYDASRREGNTLDSLIAHLSSSTAQLMLPLPHKTCTRYNVQKKEMTKIEERKKNKHTKNQCTKLVSRESERKAMGENRAAALKIKWK